MNIWCPAGSTVCCGRVLHLGLKGDPASLHGSLVRPVPQGKDPWASRFTLGHPQPLKKEGAAPAWNSILLTNGPGHPDQLTCGWWGVGVCVCVCVSECVRRYSVTSTKTKLRKVKFSCSIKALSADFPHWFVRWRWQRGPPYHHCGQERGWQAGLQREGGFRTWSQYLC